MPFHPRYLEDPYVTWQGVEASCLLSEDVGTVPSLPTPHPPSSELRALRTWWLSTYTFRPGSSGSTPCPGAVAGSQAPPRAVAWGWTALDVYQPIPLGLGSASVVKQQSEHLTLEHPVTRLHGTSPTRPHQA